MSRYGTCEIFEDTYNQCTVCDEFRHHSVDFSCDCPPNEDPFEGLAELKGWWYWCCLPGCLPEGDPIGPFKSEEEAYKDAELNGFIGNDEEE